MQGLLEERDLLGLLNNLATVHHDHAVGDLGHHTQVVRDEEHAHVELVTQVVDQVQYLGLDRHVQGGRRLVRDEQLGLARERHGDHHALAHATGHLVRVVARAVLRAGDANQAQHLDGAGPRLVLLHVGVGLDGLHDLVAHAVDGVERRHGLLEDHRDLVAAHVLHLALGKPQQVLTVKGDRAGCDVARLLQQPHDGKRRHGLARTRLAHDGEYLALLDGEGHAVHCPHHALARGELGHEVPYLEHRHRLPPP